MDVICKICDSTMQHLTEDLYICSDCTLISSSIEPDNSIYDKSYVIKYQRYERTELNQAINKHRFLALALNNASAPILDYGCGVGSFVKYANKKGHPAYGYDINPYSLFCDPATILKKYETVTFWDSIEHVLDPVGLIKALNPEWVFMCTPDTDDWRGKKSDLHQWRHYMPEEHVHYFNERSLGRLLEVAGYEYTYMSHAESKLRQGGHEKNIITVGGKRGSH